MATYVPWKRRRQGSDYEEDADSEEDEMESSRTSVLSRLESDHSIDSHSHHIFEAAQKLHQNTSMDPQQYQALQLEYEKELFDFEYKLEDRLFGWLPFGLNESFKTAHWCAPFCTFLIFILGPYCLGFAMFAILNQQITLWDQGLINPSLAKNINCAGAAVDCKFGEGFLNFKTYVQYRVAAFAMLLIPFMYIPFMIIMDISNTAMKVWETVRQPNQASQLARNYIRVSNNVQETFDMNGDRRTFTRKQTFQNCLSCSSSGHEYGLLVLFFVFHVVLGSISITFDILVAMKDVENDAKCKILDDHLGEIVENDFDIKIHFIGLYSCIVGCFYLAMTMYCMYRQYSISLARKSFKKDISNRNLNIDKIQREAELEKFRLSHRQILAESAEKSQQLQDMIMKQKETEAKLQREKIAQHAKQSGRIEALKEIKNNPHFYSQGRGRGQGRGGGGGGGGSR